MSAGRDIRREAEAQRPFVTNEEIAGLVYQWVVQHKFKKTAAALREEAAAWLRPLAGRPKPLQAVLSEYVVLRQQGTSAACLGVCT